MAKGIMYVNGQRVAFDGEKNVLSVIRKTGIEMPTFCYYSDLSVYGACRMCVVEDEKTGKIDASCSMEPRDGLRIRTNTARLLKYRRIILELMLASHNCDCTSCGKSGNCHLQDLAVQFGVHNKMGFGDSREPSEIDDTSPAILRDPSKCILCGDCVRACSETIGMGIIDFAHRGYHMRVTPAFGRKMDQTKCISCGQCAAVCPTGAISVKNEIGLAWSAIHNPNKRVVVQIAPAVRVAVGEAFGLPAGTNALDLLVTALKLMGVDEVYDTTFGADFTTIEESREFLRRLEKGGPFPMFTSCCPAWVKYLENENPKYLKHISTCKSPMEMFAAILKDRYREKDAADGKETYHVAIMPCTAKKMEAARPEFSHGGKPDVDLVLTTQEIIKMVKESGIHLPNLELESPDLPFGLGSGSAAIYGTTGGVAESVVRYCLPDKSKNVLRELSFSPLRGNEAIREASIQVGEREIKLAVVHGLIHAQELLKAIDAGEAYYDLVEVMTCPGGCVGGAGQPHGLMPTKKERAEGLYNIDRSAPFKRAERNPVVRTFLEDYGEEKCHELLHVHYPKA
ncbi:MAG: [FeFe] hydrogenase, group A [Oscillospiraceae bacterium]|nr:[FeFe] hydrogenase, group A [Oscillospiraceae bacterium]